jgi:hypothetical protein
MKAFTFTAPDGTKLIRRSKARTYVAAILLKKDGVWVLGSCVGRPELIADRLEYWGRGSPDCIAVHVD